MSTYTGVIPDVEGSQKVGNSRTQVIWRRKQESGEMVIGEGDGRTIQKEKGNEDVWKRDRDSFFIFI